MDNWPLPHFRLDPIGREWLTEFIGALHFNDVCGDEREGPTVGDCVIVKNADHVAYLALQAWARVDSDNVPEV